MEYKSYWCTHSDGTRYQIEHTDKWEERADDADAQWVDEIITEMNIKSIADVGCGTGRLFPVWARHKLTGYAVEWSDVEYPLMKKNANKIGIEPYQLDITKRHVYNKVNLVFASQLLLHIMPKDIEMALYHLGRMTNKYMVFCNWYDEKLICRDKKQNYKNTHNWVHDYYGLFAKFGYKILRDEIVTFQSGDNKIWLLEVV